MQGGLHRTSTCVSDGLASLHKRPVRLAVADAGELLGEAAADGWHEREQA
jgi:hypothetical protein